MQNLPEECVVHALGFLELEDVIDFTRTTKDASAFVTKHDKSLFEPALERLHAWRQGVGRLENEGPPLHERRVLAMDNVPWRDRYLHERADLRRTAITRDDLVAHSWRLRFREPGGGVQVREVPPRACRFLSDGMFRLEGFPPMEWSVAEDGDAVVISNFPPHRVQRRAHYDHGWTLENKNVILWSVDEMSPHWARMSSRHAAAAAKLSGNRHAREARELLTRGGVFERAGRHDRARIAFMDALAHAGGTLAHLPLGATGYLPEDPLAEDFERYQTDPGAMVVELQECYQLETLWHERNNRLYALLSLARAALETGEARQALDAARRAAMNVLHQGDFHGRARCIRDVEDLRARALLALSEEQEQRDASASPTTRPRSESFLARGLEGLGV